MRARKIKSIKKIGNVPTMDIEVNNDSHVFYADGMATSNSHAVAYAYNSYMSAWYKANYTYDFFLTYLEYSAFKPKPHQEIYELVSESKLFNIDYKMPNIKHYTPHFSRDNNTIYFGVQDIKNLTGVNGQNTIATLNKVSNKVGKDLASLSWMDILLYVSTSIDATSFKTLCSVGFFSTVETGTSRNRALYEYEIFKPLTDKEKEWILERYPEKQWPNLLECLRDLAPPKKNGGGTHNINRSKRIESEIYMLENPPYSLVDDPGWIVDQEVELVGCPVSLARIESVDTSGGNTSCKDIVNGKTGKDICLAASIVRINQHKVKRGKTKGRDMAFLSIEDETCVLDSVILFPDVRDKYSYILYEGNNLMFCGDVGDDNSFIIQKIYEI